MPQKLSGGFGGSVCPHSANLEPREMVLESEAREMVPDWNFGTWTFFWKCWFRAVIFWYRSPKLREVVGHPNLGLKLKQGEADRITTVLAADSGRTERISQWHGQIERRIANCLYSVSRFYVLQRCCSQHWESSGSLDHVEMFDLISVVLNRGESEHQATS